MQTPSPYPDIIRRARELAPFADDASAETAIVAFVSSLGRALTRDEKQLLARDLPAELAQLLLEAEPATRTGSRQAARASAALGGLSTSQAIERAIVVQRVVFEAIPAAARDRV